MRLAAFSQRASAATLAYSNAHAARAGWRDPQITDAQSPVAAVPVRAFRPHPLDRQRTQGQLKLSVPETTRTAVDGLRIALGGPGEPAAPVVLAVPVARGRQKFRTALSGPDSFVR